MSASIEQNFRMNVGEDLTVAFTVTGANNDLTGGSVSWIMRTHPLSATNVLSIAGSSVGDGTFSVVFADTDTDSIDPGVYYHEAKATVSGVETIVARGFVQLDPSVT